MIKVTITVIIKHVILNYDSYGALSVLIKKLSKRFTKRCTRIIHVCKIRNLNIDPHGKKGLKNAD